MAVPTDFAGLTLWLDAADPGATYVTTDPVDTWHDKSGSNRDFVATGTARPTYTTGASLTGLPIIRFDGATDVMTCPATWANITNNSIYTIFYVINTTATATALAGTFDNDALLNSPTNSFGGTYAKHVSAQLNYLAYNWDGTDDAAAVISAYNTWALLAQDHNNTNLRMRLNGGTAVSVASGAMTTQTSTLQFGESGNTPASFLTADVAEMIVYDSVLSDANREAVEGYLNAKWFWNPQPNKMRRWR